MKYEIKMKDKDTHEVKNSSIQDLADVQACEDFIAANPITFQDYDTEIVEYIEPLLDLSPRQIRFALIDLGIDESTVDAAINTIENEIDKKKLMAAWKNSNTYQRGQAAVAIIGALLGLNSEQLDGVWSSGINQ